MKKLASILAVTALFSCSKKDLADAKPAATTYQIRIAAVDSDGTRSYTPISRVKSGKVALEFETVDVSNLKEYNVEVSANGSNFKSVKIITADLKSPDKVYRDTLELQ